MNEIRTDRDRDDAYDDVRRAYRELGDEPVPPMLDANVLEAARAAVRPKRTRPRWIVPMALAATVLLAVGISFDVRRETAREAQQYAGDAPTEVAHDAAAMNESAKSNERAGGGAVPASPPPAFAPEPLPMDQATPAVAQREAAKAVPPPSAPMATTAAPAPAPMAPPPAPMAPVSAPIAAPIVSAPSIAAPAPPPAAAGRAAPASEASIAVPKQAGAVAPADAGAGAGAGANVHEIVAPRRAEPERAARDAATADATSAAAERRKSEAATPALDAAKRTPEQWLRDIEALRRAGRTADADAEMARFRAAYPRYPQP
jgi:hypothetical protein